MFSSRLPDNLEPNAYARLLARKRDEGARVLDLTASNPTKAGIPYPREELLAALSDARSMTYEPAPLGLPEARKAIAMYYAEMGETVNPDHIVLTASSSEAYSWLFKLLADPQGDFLIPSPSYPLFDLLAALEHVSLSPYSLMYGPRDGWRLDVEKLRREVSPETRGVIAVNPNNPTGSCLRLDERDALADICAEHGTPIVCDEVFSDYLSSADPGLVRSLVSLEDPLSFSLSGISKVCGLPQLKLGWIVVNGPEASRREALRRLELIADTYLSVGAPVQNAAARLLAMRGPIQESILARTRKNRAALTEACDARDQADVEVLASDGGWYAVVEVPDSRTDEEWALALLERDDVNVHPGYFFGFEREAFLVVSLLPREEVFLEGIERLLARVLRA